MQKATFVLFGACAALVLAGSMLAPAALAQESGSTALTTSGGGVTTADLGVPRPGLLPSNPFYFFKEWARGIRRVLIVDPVKKAEYELRVATEKAAELKRLEEVRGDARAVARAAENYAENMRRLAERLKALSETSENPDVDKLLNSLVERSLVHQELLGELKAKYGEAKDDIENVQKTVDEVLKEVPRTIDGADAFASRLKTAIEGRRESVVKELNAINILNRLGTDLPDEAQRKLSQLKDDLVLKFQGRVSAVPVNPGALEAFAGDVKEKLLVIDEVRERVLDSELKNSLSQLRDRVLKESEDRNGIKEEDAKRMIQSAEELAAKLAAQTGELGAVAPTSVKQLLLRADANIEQAKTFYASGKFGAAFGQATAAVSAVKNAMTQLAVRTQDFEKNILELKQKFDELQALAKRAELSREKYPKIFALFGEAEQMILALSKLTGTAANTDRFVALMRETKAHLGTIEAAIREALQQGSNARPLPRVMPVAPVPTVVPTEKTACIQVIQPAKDPQSGACKEFPTPCDVPLGWVPVNACAVPEAEKTLPRTDAENAPSTTVVQPSTWTISMSEEGFFPNEVKVRKGDKVIWVNKGARDHWPASAVHPTHQLYPEFDARQGVTSGASYSFVFDRVSAWKYHDHLNPGFTGAIVVSE